MESQVESYTEKNLLLLPELN